MENSGNNLTTIIIWAAVILVGLVCYIIAQVKSKRGELVFTSNGWDMFLLYACPILLLIGSFMDGNPSLETARNVLWTLGGLCFVGTVIFSIVANLGSFWKIMCSIMAKVFVIWLTMFLIILFIAALIFLAILSVARDHSDDGEEVYLVKYDHFMKAYVGYRV